MNKLKFCSFARFLFLLLHLLPLSSCSNDATTTTTTTTSNTTSITSTSTNNNYYNNNNNINNMRSNISAQHSATNAPRTYIYLYLNDLSRSFRSFNSRKC